MKIKILGKFSYQKLPIVEDMIEVSEDDLKEIGKTKQFDVEMQTIVDYIKPAPTYEERLKQYPLLVEKYIRERYSLSAELAILRQKDIKPEEFEEYNAYAEACKERARQELGINTTKEEEINEEA